MTPRSLSVLLFFISFFSVPDGFGGPLVAAYLYKAGHWTTQDIGTVQALSTICFGVLCPFAGDWMDRSKHKVYMFSVACAVIAFTTSSVVMSQDFWWILITRVVQGCAQAFIPPGIGSLTLGIVGPDEFASQMALNAAGNSIGNLAGVLVAAVASYVSPKFVFYLSAVYNTICAACCMAIPADSIRHDVASNSVVEGDTETDGKYSKYTIAAFLFTIMSFHFSNAAMLPLLCQWFSRGVTASEGLMLSNAAIGIRSLFGAGILLLMSRTQVTQRKRLALLSFSALLIRGIMLAAIASSSIAVSLQTTAGLSSQFLDAVGDELFEWTKTVVIYDLTKGTGHFNLVIGLGNFSIEVGAAVSNFVAELLIGVQSYAFAFAFLAAAAVVPLVCFASFIPETYEEGNELKEKGDTLLKQEEAALLDPAAKEL